MRTRWIAVLALGVLLGAAAASCDKNGEGGGGSGGEGQPEGERERVVNRELAQPAPSCDSSCRTLYAGVWETPRVAPWTVGWAGHQRIQIKNMLGEGLDLSGWIASTGSTHQVIPDGTSIGDRRVLTMRLGRSGPNRPDYIYLDQLNLGPVGEFALFAGGTVEAPADIRMYLRWGAAPEDRSQSHMAAAAAANWWFDGLFVETCEEYTRFGATGDVGIPRGYRNMPDTCFPDYEDPAGGSARPPGR